MGQESPSRFHARDEVVKMNHDYNPRPPGMTIVFADIFDSSRSTSPVESFCIQRCFSSIPCFPRHSLSLISCVGGKRYLPDIASPPDRVCLQELFIILTKSFGRILQSSMGWFCVDVVCCGMVGHFWLSAAAASHLFLLHCLRNHISIF